MKRTIPPELSKGRVVTGPLGTPSGRDPVGAFITIAPDKKPIQIISSISDGWEHVSVTYFRKKKTPGWDVMCFVKNLFWEADETVVQFHPPQSEYVNNHAYVLHLWKPTEHTISLPPSILVGIKGLTPDEAESKFVQSTNAKRL